MYRLYVIPGSCSTAIHVLLNKLGQPVEIVRRDDVDDYARLVPTNQVPALVVGDEILTEGAAIATWLLEEHGMAPLPGSEARAFRQWLMFNYATLHPTYTQMFVAGVYNVVEAPDGRAALLDFIGKRLSTLWSIVEARVTGRDFVMGDTPSVMDYLLALYANWGHAVPDVDIVIGPHTRSLIERTLALPEFVQAVEREGIEVQLPR